MVSPGSRVPRPSAACSPASSGEAERLALLKPGERQAGLGEQLLRGEVARMAAFEDRPDDVRGEKAQPQNPGEIGTHHPLTLRDIGEILTAALGSWLLNRCAGVTVSSSANAVFGICL